MKNWAIQGPSCLVSTVLETIRSSRPFSKKWKIGCRLQPFMASCHMSICVYKPKPLNAARFFRKASSLWDSGTLVPISWISFKKFRLLMSSCLSSRPMLTLSKKICCFDVATRNSLARFLGSSVSCQVSRQSLRSWYDHFLFTRFRRCSGRLLAFASDTFFRRTWSSWEERLLNFAWSSAPGSWLLFIRSYKCWKCLDLFLLPCSRWLW